MVRDNGSLTVTGEKRMYNPQITFDHIEDEDEKKEVPLFLEEQPGNWTVLEGTGFFTVGHLTDAPNVWLKVNIDSTGNRCNFNVLF